MNGVQVRLYDTDTGASHVLGEVALESVDRVIPTIKHWGLDNYGEFANADTFTGTFKFNEDGAYFEVSFE